MRCHLPGDRVNGEMFHFKNVFFYSFYLTLQREEELAFVMATLHFHHLVERSTLGSAAVYVFVCCVFDFRKVCLNNQNLVPS